MNQVSSSPKIPTEDEKHPKLFGDDAEGGITSISIVEDDFGSSDGDDALGLVGSHAHQFDEKYNARLRRKIVSDL